MTFRPVHYLLAVQAALALSLALVFVTRSVPQEGLWWTDFMAFRTGAELVAAGRAEDLYNIDAQREAQTVLTDGRNINPPERLAEFFASGVLGYFSPPWLAIGLVPLTGLSLDASALVVIGMNLGLVGLLLLQVRYFTRNWRPQEKWTCYASILAMYPLLNTLHLGQLSVLLAVLLMAFVLAWRSQRGVIAGICLALLTTKPQMIIYPAVILLSLRQWRPLAAAAVSGLVLMGLTTAVLGPQVWGDWLAIISQASTFNYEYGINPGQMFNIRGALWMSTVGAYGTVIRLTTAALFLAGAAIVAAAWLRSDFRRWQTGNKAEAQALLAFSLFLMLPLSPHIYCHDLLVGVVPAVLFYDLVRNNSRWRTAYAALVGVTTVLLTAGSADWVDEVWHGGFARLGALLLLVHSGFAGSWLWAQHLAVSAPQPVLEPASASSSWQ